jgi:hypothetical protein
MFEPTLQERLVELGLERAVPAFHSPHRAGFAGNNVISEAVVHELELARTSEASESRVSFGLFRL